MSDSASVTDHRPVTEQSYEWRHGWVPLTMRAALLKAHGNRDAAAALLGEARERRRRRRAARGPVAGPPIPRTVTGERARWAGLDDDALAAAMGAADDADLDSLVKELDRRDRAARKAEAARARRAAARHARDARRSAEFEAACDAGEDAAAAYARIWGIDEERVRRAEVSESLRSAGYKGKGIDQLVRHAFRDHVDQAHADAEDVCRGALLTGEGLALEAKGKLRPRDLFTGPESRARKYASRELLDYWQTNGRLTVADFRASVLGGHMRSASTAAWA